MFLPHPRVKVSIVGSLRDREVACSASDRQGSNFESCVWRTVSSQSSHHPQEVLLAQFSLYVHKGGLKPDSFNFLVCRLDKLLSWFFTQTFVVNFRYYMFCLCNVRRQYLLPGILGIYCFLTCVPSLPAIALPKGRICSLVNQVYTSFPLMSLPPFGLH